MVAAHAGTSSVVMSRSGAAVAATDSMGSASLVPDHALAPCALTVHDRACGRAVRHGCAAELVNHCFTVLPLWSALSSLLVRTLIKELGRSGSALSIDWGAPMHHHQDPFGEEARSLSLRVDPHEVEHWTA